MYQWNKETHRQTDITGMFGGFENGVRAQETEESTPEKLVPWKPPPSTIESLNKTMKAVYTLMQQSTAKGKLLAEQVRNIPLIALGRLLTCVVVGPVPVTHW